MNRKLLIISVVLILILASISGCYGKKLKTPTNVNNTNIQKQLPTSKPKGDRTKQIIKLKYEVTLLPSITKLEQNTPWETSPEHEFNATIEGKGSKAQEEGYSYIIIKDKKTNRITKLTLANEKKVKLAAKDIEWIDESNMFVILGYPFGTVSMGGKIYKLDIRSGALSLYLSTKSDREEFMTIHKTSKGFIFEKYVYDDNNYNSGHKVRGILKLK